MQNSGAIPMHSGVPQGSVIGPLLFLLFVNDLPDVLETLTLLFADYVNMVTRRSQSMNLHSSLTAAWDWSKKWDLPINPTKCNYLTIRREVPLRLSFFPRWVWHPHPCIHISQEGSSIHHITYLGFYCLSEKLPTCPVPFI